MNGSPCGVDDATTGTRKGKVEVEVEEEVEVEGEEGVEVKSEEKSSGQAPVPARGRGMLRTLTLLSQRERGMRRSKSECKTQRAECKMADRTGRGFSTGGEGAGMVLASAGVRDSSVEFVSAESWFC